MFGSWGNSVVKFLRSWLCIAEFYYIGLDNALYISHHKGLDKVTFKITQPFLDDVAIITNQNCLEINGYLSQTRSWKCSF